MEAGDPVARRRLAIAAAAGGLLLLLLVSGAWLMLAGETRPDPATALARSASPGLAAEAATVAAITAPIASLDDEPVLRALFGNWDPKTRSATWDLSALAPDLRGHPSNGSGRAQASIPARVAFSEGGRDKVALVLQSVELDKDGAPLDCHVCGALLGVQVYARAAGGQGWLRERGSNAVMHVGTYGSIPDPRLVELAPGRAGLALEGGDMGQGYTSQYAVLVDMGGDTPRGASEFIDLGASNEGACDASVKPGTPIAEPGASEACWSYKGTLVLAPPAAPRAPSAQGVAWHDLTVRWRGTRAAPNNGVDAFEQAVTVQHDGRSWPGRIGPKLLLP